MTKKDSESARKQNYHQFILLFYLLHGLNVSISLCVVCKGWFISGDT